MCVCVCVSFTVIQKSTYILAMTLLLISFKHYLTLRSTIPFPPLSPLSARFWIAQGNAIYDIPKVIKWISQYAICVISWNVCQLPEDPMVYTSMCMCIQLNFYHQPVITVQILLVLFCIYSSYVFLNHLSMSTLLYNFLFHFCLVNKTILVHVKLQPNIVQKLSSIKRLNSQLTATASLSLRILMRKGNAVNSAS